MAVIDSLGLDARSTRWVRPLLNRTPAERVPLARSALRLPPDRDAEIERGTATDRRSAAAYGDDRVDSATCRLIPPCRCDRRPCHPLEKGRCRGSVRCGTIRPAARLAEQLVECAASKEVAATVASRVPNGSSESDSADDDVQALGAVLGDYRRFFEDLVEQVAAKGIDVSSYPLGHLAFRTESREDYLDARAALESVSAANVEDEWHGRPISKLLLRTAVPLGAHHHLSLVELIPPPHRPAYARGLEHLGFVLGDQFDSFAALHRAIITGQQDQGPYNQPLFVAVGSGRMVKFHRYSLYDVVVMEGHTFDGFRHAR